MFVLQDSPEPFWMSVAEGIEIQLKPAGTEALMAARREVRLALRDDIEADHQVPFVFGFVAWGAVAWRGIGDAEGQPLSLTPERLGQLLRQRPDIYDRLDRDYAGPVMELLAEKKGSSASANGTSAEVQPIATPAPSVTSAPTTAKPVRTERTKPGA